MTTIDPAAIKAEHDGLHVCNGAVWSEMSHGRCLPFLLAQQNADLQARMSRLRDYWLQPTEPNDFHINGFPTRIDQLADLFDEEAAQILRAALDGASTD